MRQSEPPVHSCLRVPKAGAASAHVTALAGARTQRQGCGMLWFFAVAAAVGAAPLGRRPNRARPRAGACSGQQARVCRGSAPVPGPSEAARRAVPARLPGPAGRQAAALPQGERPLAAVQRGGDARRSRRHDAAEPSCQPRAGQAKGPRIAAAAGACRLRNEARAASTRCNAPCCPPNRTGTAAPSDAPPTRSLRDAVLGKTRPAVSLTAGQIVGGWKRGCQAANLEVTNRCWSFRPCSRPARS